MQEKDQAFLSTLGENIRRMRMSKGYSQVELADLCHFDQANMSKIEAGKANMTVITLKTIADALKVSPESLFAKREE